MSDAKREGIYILEFDHAEKLELKVLKLPRSITSIGEYAGDAELRERAECIKTAKIPSHSEDWEEVEMMIHEMGFEVIEWQIGDRKDLILVRTR